MRDDVANQATNASAARDNGLNGLSEEIVRPARLIRQGENVHPQTAMMAATHAAASSHGRTRSKPSRALGRRHARIAPLAASATIVAPGKTSPSDRPHPALHPHSPPTRDPAN